MIKASKRETWSEAVQMAVIVFKSHRKVLGLLQNPETDVDSWVIFLDPILIGYKTL